jgi:hypothetical protein
LERGLPACELIKRGQAVRTPAVASLVRFAPFAFFAATFDVGCSMFPFAFASGSSVFSAVKKVLSVKIRPSSVVPQCGIRG